MGEESNMATREFLLCCNAYGEVSSPLSGPREEQNKVLSLYLWKEYFFCFGFEYHDMDELWRVA